MKKEEVVTFIISLGWKSSGLITPNDNGSLYEEFHQKNKETLWLGDWYLESEKYMFAFPYAEDRMTSKDLLKFINKGVIK